MEARKLPMSMTDYVNHTQKTWALLTHIEPRYPFLTP